MSFQQWAAAGFGAELTPVARGDKRAFLPGWTTRPAAPDDPADWDRGRFNVGLRTAQFPVVDVDVDDLVVADAVEAVVRELAGPAPVRSRGNARRALLFRREGPPLPKRIISFTLPSGEGAKVELLGDGQQLVVEGLHPAGTQYAWTALPVASALPALDADTVDRLADAIRETVKAAGCTLPNGKSTKLATTPATGEWVEVKLPPPMRHETWADVEGLAREALDKLDPDMAHAEWLDVGMALHAKDPDRGYSAWVSWSSRGKKFPGEDAMRRRWASFKQGGGISFGTLLAMAGLSGRLTPATPAVGPPTVEPAPKDARVVLLPLLESGARLFDVKLPRTEYVVLPYVPRREVIEVSGPHGHMKSSVTLNLLLSVATGRPWGGIPVIKGPTTFITMEDTEAVIQARAFAFIAAIEDLDERMAAEDEIRRHFTYLSREKAQSLALTYTEGTRSTSVATYVVDHLASILDGRILVSLETSSRLHPGPEDHVGLAALATAVERIATSTGASTAVGRHHTKSSAREGAGDSYAGSGAAVFSNAARSVLTIEQDGRRKPKPGEEPEERDPFAIVRLRQTKPPPLAAPGGPLAWRPTLVDTDVGRHLHLVAVTASEEAREAGLKLLRHLHESGEITKSDLKKSPPCSLPWRVAVEAMELLHAQGKTRISEQVRGKTNQKAWVWTLT